MLNLYIPKLSALTFQLYMSKRRGSNSVSVCKSILSYEIYNVLCILHDWLPVLEMEVKSNSVLALHFLV